MLWTKAIWSLQNPGRARIKRADPCSLLISFQRLSQPQSIIQLHALQRSTFIQALCLSRCLQRGLFSAHTSGLISLPCRVPARERPSESWQCRSKCSSQRAHAAVPRRPAGLRASAPPRWGTAAPLLWKGAKTGKAASSHRAQSPCTGKAVNLR